MKAIRKLYARIGFASIIWSIVLVLLWVFKYPDLMNTSSIFIIIALVTLFFFAGVYLIMKSKKMKQ